VESGKAGKRSRADGPDYLVRASETTYRYIELYRQKKVVRFGLTILMKGEANESQENWNVY
jgi:hypothetical protein